MAAVGTKLKTSQVPVALNRLLKVLIYDERAHKVTRSRPPDPLPLVGGGNHLAPYIGDSWYTPSSLSMVGMFVLICILSSIHFLNLKFFRFDKNGLQSSKLSALLGVFFRSTTMYAIRAFVYVNEKRLKSITCYFDVTSGG